MHYQYLIETPEHSFEVIAKNYIEECQLSHKFQIQVKSDCGHFYFLNRIIEPNNSECIDYINIDLPKAQFIRRLQFWDKSKKQIASPVFDPKTLAHLTEQINYQWTQKIIRSFLDTTEKHFPILANALIENNIGVMSKTAHYLKSSSAVVGAIDLLNLCEICLEKSKYNEPWTKELVKHLSDIEFAINSARGFF